MHAGWMIEIVAAAALALGGCPGRAAVQCTQDSDCDLVPFGTCDSYAGDLWCSYPDPACAAGRRWSDDSTGDGLGGTCQGASTPMDAGIDSPRDSSPIDGGHHWSTPVKVDNVNSSGSEYFPALSGDGLDLYFARGSLSPPYGEIYMAHRAAIGATFGTPVAVTSVNGANSNEVSAVPGHTPYELFVSSAGSIVKYSRQTPTSAWSSPSNTGISANSVSLSADDLTMYFVRVCAGGSGPCVWKATRSALGQNTWSTPVSISWDGTVQWNYIGVSGDGLRMLVSQQFTSGTGVPIALETRTTADMPWSGTEIIGELALETTNQQARFSADETEIFLTAQPTTSTNGYDIYRSVLQ